MKILIILSYLCVLALSVPVPNKVFKVAANIPRIIEVEATNPAEAIRKVRQIVDIDIDVYNNNGYGYFGMFSKRLVSKKIKINLNLDNGDDFGGNGGGYGGYGGGYGGYGGYGGGYGGYGGY